MGEGWKMKRCDLLTLLGLFASLNFTLALSIVHTTGLPLTFNQMHLWAAFASLNDQTWLNYQANSNWINVCLKVKITRVYCGGSLKIVFSHQPNSQKEKLYFAQVQDQPVPSLLCQ